MPEAIHSDIIVSSIAFGFTFGFGVLTAWEAVKQTMHARSPLRSIYIWLVWGEIAACFSLAIVLFLMLTGVVKVGFVLLIVILILWSLKLQFIIQIIVNRINIIITDNRWSRKLKWLSAMAIMVLIAMGFATWLPAQMQIPPFPKINFVVERIIKGSYLVIDAALNYLFVIKVKQCLVEQGSKKYDKLVRFNIRIILISLAMDVLIIGTMSMKNPLVYTQMHPLGFVVKLRIELAMAELIRKVAAQKNEIRSDSYGISLGTSRGGAELTTTATGMGKSTTSRPRPQPNTSSRDIMVSTTVVVDVDEGARAGPGGASSAWELREDVEPLRESWQPAQV